MAPAPRYRHSEVDVMFSIGDYLRRPRPRLTETSVNLREILVIFLVGPCFLVGFVNELIDEGPWPALLMLPVSAAITIWAVAWLQRPTEVSRTSRRE